MLISPFFILGFLLVGAGFTYFVAARRPRYTIIVPPCVSALGLLLWFLLGRQLPQPISFGDLQNSSLIPTWQWMVDETVWSLGGILLFFVFTLFIFRIGETDVSSIQVESFNFRLNRAQWRPVLLLCLAAAGLAVMWAATVMTLMMTWTLLGLLWTLFLLTTAEPRTDLSSVLPRFFWILVPLLFAGIAAASMPYRADLLDIGNWPTITVVAALLTVMSQIGILPFVGWRPRSKSLPLDAGAVLHLLPSLAGAGLLARLVSTGQFDSNIVLLLTLVALFGILTGLRRIWMYGHSSSRLAADLAMSLSGLAFLVGIWTGAAALIAAVRLLIFPATILFLLDRVPLLRSRWWRGIAPLLAFVALAGFPFTAGFTTITSTYDVWIANSRPVFVLALAALWLPLLTAVLIRIRINIRSQSMVTNSGIGLWLKEGSLMLLAVGLIMVSGRSLTDVHLVTWLVLLITGAGAVFLSRYVGEVQNVVVTVNAAFVPGKQQFSRSWLALGRIGQQIMFTLSEAASILEGEWGLLWLTAFLAAIFFALVI